MVGVPGELVPANCASRSCRVHYGTTIRQLGMTRVIAALITSAARARTRVGVASLLECSAPDRLPERRFDNGIGRASTAWARRETDSRGASHRATRHIEDIALGAESVAAALPIITSIALGGATVPCGRLARVRPSPLDPLLMDDETISAESHPPGRKRLINARRDRPHARSSRPVHAGRARREGWGLARSGAREFVPGLRDVRPP